MDDDLAEEWLFNIIETPIAAAIKNTLEQFFADATDDVKKCEAEAAVAFLLDWTMRLKDFKYVKVRFLSSLARENDLWNDSIRAIKMLRSDKTWLQGWSQPDKKIEAFDDLLGELEIAKRDAAAN